MPVVSPDALVLVTGATGYIASHCVDELLRRGFRVRGTVRTLAKGESLKRVFSEAGDRFHYVVVEDLAKKGAFDEAVKDVQGILHVASPLYRRAPAGVWENIIRPAKLGTTSILNASVRYNPNVKRIVITSSFTAIGNMFEVGDKDRIFSEKDWNVSAIEKAQAAADEGSNLDPASAYSASKIWAEKAAWGFIEVEKPTSGMS